MGSFGSTTVDFGAFPGSSDTSVAVTGQTGILSGSLVEAWCRPVDTVDHLADEHLAETFKVMAGSIVAGVGFTIYALNTSQLNEPLAPAGVGGGTAGPFKGSGGAPYVGGQGTRLYGQFTVAWVWR